MPDYRDLELPGAIDIPWREPKPRPVAPWCRRKRTSATWVRSEPLPPPWMRGLWDHSPPWCWGEKRRPWD